MALKPDNTIKRLSGRIQDLQNKAKTSHKRFKDHEEV